MLPGGGCRTAVRTMEVGADVGRPQEALGGPGKRSLLSGQRLGLPVSFSTGLPRLCPSPCLPIGADPQL